MSDNLSHIGQQIEELEQADYGAVRKRWRTLFRKAFPEHFSRHLVVALMVYRIQADAFGDLSKEEEAYLTGLRARTDNSGPVQRFGEEGRKYQPGTMFVREHEGITHRVVCSPDGFEWNGQKFKSLSATALAITGTKWNGLRFFGVPVAKRERHGRA